MCDFINPAIHFNISQGPLAVILVFITVSWDNKIVLVTIQSRTQPLKALTVHITSTYQNINPHFRYDLTYNPRRVLTKPSKGAKNDGFDNEDCDYILYVNDILGGEEGQK